MAKPRSVRDCTACPSESGRPDPAPRATRRVEDVQPELGRFLRRGYQIGVIFYPLGDGRRRIRVLRQVGDDAHACRVKADYLVKPDRRSRSCGRIKPHRANID